MELKMDFTYRGWTIKYNLLRPGTSGTEEDTARPIVFIHGTPWSSVAFKSLVTRLLQSPNASSPILIYDLAGYGRSQHYTPQPTELPDTLFQSDTSVKFQAEVLAALLSHLHIDGADPNPSPNVIAHDIAGSIALRAHLLLGCEFHSLLLMDTNCVLPWGDGFYKLVRSHPGVFLQLPAHVYEAMLRATIQSAVHDPEKLKKAEKWEDQLAAPWLPSHPDDAGGGGSQRQKAFVQQIAQANDRDVAEMEERNLYGHVSCPVRILWGQDDQWIPKEKMVKMAGLLGDQLDGFVEIEDAGHLIMIDQPEVVYRHVEEWLGKQS